MEILESIQILKKIIDNTLTEISKETGITLNETKVLTFLYENERFDIASDIVENLMISKAHVSVSVESLVKKNYIKKVQDDKDKKKFHLKITNKSKEIVDVLEKEIIKLKNDLLENIDAQEKEQFKATLTKILENAKAIT